MSAATNDPAGSVRRGELSVLDAVGMITDLRDFTRKANTWNEEALLDALDRYFEIGVQAGQAPLDFGPALHLGRVTYGNIGSPDRPDFTVIGETVNVVSRVEGLCKALGEPILCTGPIADHVGDDLRSVGLHRLRGVSEPMELFAMAE